MRILFLAAMALAGGAALAEEGAGLPGQSWRVVAAGGTEFTPEDEVTMDFVEGMIAGRSGCNRYTGAAQLTARTPLHGALTLGPVAGTRMACMGRAGEIEPVFLGALGRADAWRVEPDGSLSLLAEGEVVIRAQVLAEAGN